MAYRWGDGKGKIHTISLGAHKKNVRQKRAADRAGRKAKADQADRDRLTAPRGYGSVLRDAEAAANLRYAPEERALGLQQAQIPAWFAQYQTGIAAQQAASQARVDTAANLIGAQATATQNATNTAQQGLQQQANQSASSRGAKDSGQNAKDAVAAAGVTAQSGNAIADLLRAQGVAQGNYLGGLGTAAGAAQLTAQTQNAKDRVDLGRDRGAYKSQYVSDARDSERKYGLERSAFGLEVDKAQADVQTDRAKIKSDSAKDRAARRDKDRQYKLDVQKFGATKAKDRYQRRTKTGPYKVTGSGGSAGLTPAQKRAQAEKRSKATSRVTDAEGRWNLYKTVDYTPKGGKPRKPTPTEIKQRLIKEGFSTQEIHLALMWSQNKPWTARDRAIAKRLGIHLPKRKKAKPAKPVKPTTSLINPFD